MSRKCPICKSDKTEFITKLCSNMKIMGEHFKNSEADLVCCQKCGLVFSNIEATQDDFNKYYTSPNCCPLSYKNFMVKKTQINILMKFSTNSSI